MWLQWAAERAFWFRFIVRYILYVNCYTALSALSLAGRAAKLFLHRAKNVLNQPSVIIHGTARPWAPPLGRRTRSTPSNRVPLRYYLLLFSSQSLDLRRGPSHSVSCDHNLCCNSYLLQYILLSKTITDSFRRFQTKWLYEMQETCLLKLTMIDVTTVQLCEQCRGRLLLTFLT